METGPGILQVLLKNKIPGKIKGEKMENEGSTEGSTKEKREKHNGEKMENERRKYGKRRETHCVEFVGGIKWVQCAVIFEVRCASFKTRSGASWRA